MVDVPSVIGETVDPSEGGGAPEPKKIDREAVAKGFAWTSASSFVAKIIFPLAGLYVNRRLGPTILGMGLLIQTTVQISEVIRDAGLSQTFLAEKEIDEPLIGAYTALKLLTSLVPAVLLLFLAHFLAVFFRVPELNWAVPVVSLCVLMDGLGAVPNARLLRKGEFKTQGLIGVAAGSVALAVTVVLVSLGVGFPALVVQTLVFCSVNLFLSVRAQPLVKPNFDWPAMAERSRRARSLLGANILNNVFLLFDAFVIQRLVGSKAAGLYNTSQNIAYKPADLFLFPLSTTLMVAFGQTHDKSKLAGAYWRSIKAIVLLLIPVYAFIGINSDGLTLLLLGPRFAGGIPVLSVLCIYLCFRTFGNISGNALIPIGKHSWTFYSWIFALVVTGTSLAVIYRHPTLMNVVWSFTIGAMAVYTSIFCICAYWLRPERAHLKEIAKAAVVLALTGCALLSLHHLGMGPIPRTLLTVPLVGALHLAVAGLVFARSPIAFTSPKGIRALYRTL